MVTHSSSHPKSTREARQLHIDESLGDGSAELAALGERYFTVQHSYDPYNATLLGLSEFDQLPGDASFEASQDASSQLAAIGKKVDALDVGRLSTDEIIDRSVLSSLVHGAQQDAEHSLWAANASAKGYVSRQALVFQAIPAMTAADPESADRYCLRLAGLGRFFAGIGERYAAEAASGRPPTACGVMDSITQLDGYLALPVERDALLAAVSTSHDPGLRKRAESLLEHEVRPAMAALAERLRGDILPTARADDRVSISTVRGGRDSYIAAVARHTTTDLTPVEIHRIGLDVLEQTRSEWQIVGQRALGESDFGTIAGHMRTDPGLRFDTSAQIVAVAQAALDRANTARDRYFPVYDIGDCVIEEINPIDAEHSALAYYRPPAVDGSRPGAHCLSATNPSSRFRFEYEALAFHESVPGHHLQLALAQKLDIPRYRRYLDVEACSFNEGWGLYSEQLADEMGLYGDDLSRLGMLSFRALRACRLVVDTGLHHLGWTRAQAVDVMFENTATTREHVTSEVDHYIAWPGQALAYLIGRREIVRLRAGAKQQLGPRFSVSDFHAGVLGHGAVPLTVLADIIGRWTAGVPDPRRTP